MPENRADGFVVVERFVIAVVVFCECSAGPGPPALLTAATRSGPVMSGPMAP